MTWAQLNKSESKWATWHYCDAAKATQQRPTGAVGEVIKFEPEMDAFYAYLLAPTNALNNRGSGPVQLGRFTDLDLAKAAVETAYNKTKEAL